jgi:hypothetical protein
VRLTEFHLEIEPSKTRLLEFGRIAEESARRRGERPETFDFLGFTHYCGHTRSGRFKVKRKTSGKKFRTKLKETKERLQRERSHLKKGQLLRRAKLKLQGHLNYYGITDNGEMCHAFKHQMTRLVNKWLNRQSQKRSYEWERFNDALHWVGWPTQLIIHQLSPYRALARKERSVPRRRP